MRADPAPIRLAELLASVSLATDAGTGQPLGHALSTCVIAVGLAEATGCDAELVRTVHQATLLRFLGCTSDSADTARMTGGDDIAFNATMAPAVMGSRRELMARLVRTVAADAPPMRRTGLVMRALADPGGGARSLSTHCEVAAQLAVRIGLAAPVVEALAHAYERWDGAGFPDGRSGEDLPLPVRIFVVARDVDLALRAGIEPSELLESRKGRAYDPGIVEAFSAFGAEVVGQLDGADEWTLALAAEPAPVAMVDASRLDDVLRAFADFADLKSPWIRGHARRVASIARDAGGHDGLGADACEDLYRAGLVHDLGQVAVRNGIWDKPAPLTGTETEAMRLHAYMGDRVLARCTPLAGLREIASCAHERVDGTGYHRGLSEPAIGTAGRILAASDVYAALTADRPHRPAYPVDEAARMLEDTQGLDPNAVRCVLAASGERPAPSPTAAPPAGLTEREAEVLTLIARGHTNREVASELFISAKTVGRHVENLYRKIGVSSRAAAAVFAMEHGMLD